MSASSGVMVHMSLFLPGKKVTLASKVIKHPPSSQSSIQKTFGNTLSFSRSPHPTAMWETTSTPASSSQFHSRLWSGFLQLIQSLPECGRGGLPSPHRWRGQAPVHMAFAGPSGSPPCLLWGGWSGLLPGRLTTDVLLVPFLGLRPVLSAEDCGLGSVCSLLAELESRLLLP